MLGGDAASTSGAWHVFGIPVPLEMRNVTWVWVLTAARSGCIVATHVRVVNLQQVRTGSHRLSGLAGFDREQAAA